jgi:Spy/CpxP family protein refolding chaperone
LLALIFALGAASGALGTYGYVQPKLAPAQVAEGRGDPGEALERRRLGALVRRLDLDEDQAARVRQILEAHRGQMRALGRDMFERCGAPLRAHRESMDAEIREVLRPEQRSRFDAMVTRHRDRVWFGPGPRDGEP